ncbi:MAG: ComF family protein [Xanthobacteraceae bacterium]
MTAEHAYSARRAISLRDAAQHVLSRAVDLVLPPACAACREPVAGSGGLCARCWAKLSFTARPYCERLGTPFAHDPGPGVLSVQAIADPPAYGRARAAVRYDEIARALVHALKYGDGLDLAPLLGRWMSEAGRDLLADANAVIPVPLHWRRRWARRFNQATALAKIVSQRSGVPLVNGALRRVRATAQQVGLARSERARNVQAAFRVAEQGAGMIRGKRIVLIDDVLTSGATADTCARVLLRRGALSVDVLVFACVINSTN